MKVIVMLAWFMSFLATPVLAGEIWGIVRENRVPQIDLIVRISCNGDQLREVRTDEYGLYTVFASKPGSCQLEIYKCDKPVHNKAIFSSSSKPVRCDVHLIPDTEPISSGR